MSSSMEKVITKVGPRIATAASEKLPEIIAVAAPVAVAAAPFVAAVAVGGAIGALIAHFAD